MARQHRGPRGRRDDGSTETTFYTIAVYFGSAGIVRTRHTVPAALAADFTGFLAAAWTVRLFFGP